MILDPRRDRQTSASNPSVPEAPFLSVVIPAYNEAARIEASLRRLQAYLDARPFRYELLVVDDGSRDDTAARVRRVAAGHSHLRLLRYEPNRGKGYAVRHGMRQGNRPVRPVFRRRSVHSHRGAGNAAVRLAPAAKRRHCDRLA
jgi:cellulose synthase/poly-beta-1,6-N-acetylglucosamine synthase-like glycosyltransferase